MGDYDAPRPQSHVNSTIQEPIAIVGATCRLAGDADSMHGLWNMMRKSQTGHAEVPKERWDAEAWYHPDPDRKGAVSRDP